MIPTDRRYSKEHEWVLVDGNEATVGITHYAQDQLGDIVFVELPEEDAEVARGELVGTIESVKAVSEIYAPITGKILAVNTDLEGVPEKMNGDPNGTGWYCKMSVTNSDELAELMDAAAYEALTAEG